MSGLKVEIDRRRSKKAQILAALQRGPQTSRQLNAICYRYSARIWELRGDGFVITKSPVPEAPGQSLWRYELLPSEPP